ncbi:MAG: PIN domain-containing protein [Oscillospiraceae bacterium]|nr:PIN domain-containing protein [Oscillospiraceae bacterium]
MKVMIDTNIILDVVFDREGLADTSAKILRMCEDKRLNGVITASSITDIFYIVRKHLHSKDSAYEVLEKIMEMVDIVTVSGEHIKTAFQKRANDFEDCLMSVCAESNRCDFIVTRNKSDFTDTVIKVVTPEELLLNNSAIIAFTTS